MSRPAKKCVYCGAQGVTKEHIFGKWSIKYSNQDLSRNNHLIRRFYDPKNPDILNSVSGVGALDRAGHPRSVSLKIACQACNNGWMKNIQDNVIDIVVPLSNGEWKNLRHDEIRKLASWAVMAMMSLEFSDIETVSISQNERNFIRQNGYHSDNWMIAIGRCEEFRDGDMSFHRGMGLNPDIEFEGHRKSCLIVFTFGKLIFFMHYSEFRHIRYYPFDPRNMFFDICNQLQLTILNPYHKFIDKVPFYTKMYSDRINGVEEVLYMIEEMSRRE